MMCSSSKSASSTVDYESDMSGAYISQLDAAIKTFNDNLVETQKAFQNLLAALDHSGQIYANMAASSNDPNKAPINEFRDGMRNLTDRGPFVTFNTELHTGTISVFDDVKTQLVVVKNSEKELNDKQKKYDSARKAVENIEKEAAKKGKPLVTDSKYNKAIEKRDAAKNNYDQVRSVYSKDTENLKKMTTNALHKSLNSYIASTATLCGYLETTLNGYRSDLNDPGKARSTELTKLKDRASTESRMRRERLNSEASYVSTNSNQPPRLSSYGNGKRNSSVNPLQQGYG